MIILDQKDTINTFNYWKINFSIIFLEDTVDYSVYNQDIKKLILLKEKILMLKKNALIKEKKKTFQKSFSFWNKFKAIAIYYQILIIWQKQLKEQLNYDNIKFINLNYIKRPDWFNTYQFKNINLQLKRCKIQSVDILIEWKKSYCIRRIKQEFNYKFFFRNYIEQNLDNIINCYRKINSKFSEHNLIRIIIPKVSERNLLRIPRKVKKKISENNNKLINSEKNSKNIMDEKKTDEKKIDEKVIDEKEKKIELKKLYKKNIDKNKINKKKIDEKKINEKVINEKILEKIIKKVIEKVLEKEIKDKKTIAKVIKKVIEKIIEKDIKDEKTIEKVIEKVIEIVIKDKKKKKEEEKEKARKRNFWNRTNFYKIRSEDIPLNYDYKKKCLSHYYLRYINFPIFLQNKEYSLDITKNFYSLNRKVLSYFSHRIEKYVLKRFAFKTQKYKNNFLFPNFANYRYLFKNQIREQHTFRWLYRLSYKQLVKIFKKITFYTKTKFEFIFVKYLELRLDTIVYRLNIAFSLKQAKQWVKKKFFLVNGSLITWAKYQVNLGDIIIPIFELRLQIYPQREFSGDFGINYNSLRLFWRPIQSDQYPKHLLINERIPAGLVITNPNPHNIIYIRRWNVQFLTMSLLKYN